MKVKDVMTLDVTTLSPDKNAQEALDLLIKMQISGLPVIDENDKLIGMFTEKEILSFILPSYLDSVGSFEYEQNPKAARQKALTLKNLKVKDLARSEVITINEDATLCEAAHIMIMRKARRLPVVNKEKKVVGIICRGDVLRAIFDEYTK